MGLLGSAVAIDFGSCCAAARARPRLPLEEFLEQYGTVSSPPPSFGMEEARMFLEFVTLGAGTGTSLVGFFAALRAFLKGDADKVKVGTNPDEATPLPEADDEAIARRLAEQKR